MRDHLACLVSQVPAKRSTCTIGCHRARLRNPASLVLVHADRRVRNLCNHDPRISVPQGASICQRSALFGHRPAPWLLSAGGCPSRYIRSFSTSQQKTSITPWDDPHRPPDYNCCDTAAPCERVDDTALLKLSLTPPDVLVAANRRVCKANERSEYGDDKQKGSTVSACPMSLPNRASAREINRASTFVPSTASTELTAIRSSISTPTCVSTAGRACRPVPSKPSLLMLTSHKSGSTMRASTATTLSNGDRCLAKRVFS